jgi:hypothetical protein
MIKLNLSLCFTLALILIAGTSCSNSEKETIQVKTVDGVIMNPSTGKWQGSNLEPLQFDLVQTIDLSTIEEPVISNLGYLRLDDEGNFYFYDRNISQLISVDPEGNLRWAVGQEGKGPGDFETPFGMDIYNDKIYVMNVQGSRLDEFDMNGSFIRSIEVPKSVQFPSLVGIRDDGLILLSGAKFGTVGTEIYTARIGDSLQVVDNFSIVETDDEEYERATTRGSVSMGEDMFVYSFSIDYRYHIYSYNGELLTQVDRDFDGVLGPGIYAVEGSVSMYSLGRVGSRTMLDDGKYLIEVRYPINIKDPNAYARRASTGETESPEYAEFLDLYSANHELLYTFNDNDFVEGLGNLSIRDANGYYYSPFSSDLVIKKYDIKPQTNEMQTEEFDIEISD